MKVDSMFQLMYSRGPSSVTVVEHGMSQMTLDVKVGKRFFYDVFKPSMVKTNAKMHFNRQEMHLSYTFFIIVYWRHRSLSDVNFINVVLNVYKHFDMLD